MDIITSIEEFINDIGDTINKLAVETGFKQRKSKIKPETYLMAMILGQVELHEITLDTLVGKLEEIQEGLDLTKQALHQRMEAGSRLLEKVYAVVFTKNSLKSIKLETMEVLKQFKDIKITDGTTISLPDKLKNFFKGLGGNNADAAIKLQVTYSVFKHEFVGLDYFSATKNDATYNEETLRTIEAEELIIKDLGYYNGDYFQKIDSKNAYYISRIKTNCVLYALNKGKYEIVDITKMLKDSKIDLDKRLFIKLSSGDMYETRLTGVKLPRKISDERKRKAYKNAKNNGKQLTAKEIQLLDWFLVITNVEEDKLSVETICELYRLRWQIELQFRALKSSMDFDKFGNAGEHYFRCLLFSKLIMLILTMRIFAICRIVKFNESGRLVSIQKFMRNFRNNIKFLVNALLNTSQKTLKKLEQFILRIAKRSFFDKRRRQTTEENLMTHDLPENVLNMLIAGSF